MLPAFLLESIVGKEVQDSVGFTGRGRGLCVRAQGAVLSVSRVSLQAAVWMSSA